MFLIIKRFIPVEFKRFIKRNILKENFRQISYSQIGEDRIIWYLLVAVLGLKKIFYLDIGANDPMKYSNTYLFYKEKLGRGVLVEPNELLCKELKMKRPKDKCYNIGISTNRKIKVLPFYRINPDVLSTFSKVEAEKFENMGYLIEKIVKVPVIDINKLLKRIDQQVDFLSIDVEGLDYEIITSIDFKIYRPTCICMESADFVGDKSKLQSLTVFMKRNNYRIYADTGLNTIFVDSLVV